MKKPITIVSSICIFLFLVAIIWLGAGIYNDKKNGSEKADQRFSTLLSETEKNFSSNRYGTSQFSTNFIRSIGNIDDFSSLKLEINDELVYSYPPERFSLPSPELVKSYSQTIYQEQNSFTLKASIFLMKPNSVYNHSRIAFILILFATVFAGIFILVFNARETDSTYSFKENHARKSYSDFLKDSASKTEQKNSKTDLKDDDIQQETNLSESESFPAKPQNETDEKLSEPQKPIFNPNISENQKTALIEDAETPAENKNDDSEITISFDDEPLFDSVDDDEDAGLDIIDQMEQENAQAAQFDETDSEPDEQAEPNLDFEETPTITFDDDFSDSDEEDSDSVEPLVITEEPKAPEKSEPVSPVTKLFLQNSLEEKFDEIIQGGDTQATLVLIKINGLDRGNAISEKVISILKNEHNNSQVFEYKADGYAIILPQNDLQTSVDDFEQIYNKISDFLKDNNAANEVSVGISSASGRNVKAERVILEANQALDYASQDPDSPIVAFRVKA